MNNIYFNFKKLFQYVLMAIILIDNAMAMDPDENSKTLIVGCRPWDKNLEEVDFPASTHFIDFQAADAPEPRPAQFHHCDLNDKGVNEAAKFSEFAVAHPGEFNTILIDWMTWGHIRRDDAWEDFKTLLATGGQVVVPITHRTRGVCDSMEEAERFTEKLRSQFAKIDIKSYDDLPVALPFNLLHREKDNGITFFALTSKPAIIIATK